jgi:hypothetical protein
MPIFGFDLVDPPALNVAPLLVRPLNRLLAQDEATANHEFPIAKDLRFPTVGLAMEAQFAGPRHVILPQ